MKKDNPRCYGCNKPIGFDGYIRVTEGQPDEPVSYCKGYAPVGEQKISAFCTQRCAVEFARIMVEAGHRIGMRGKPSYDGGVRSAEVKARLKAEAEARAEKKRHEWKERHKQWTAEVEP